MRNNKIDFTILSSFSFLNKQLILFSYPSLPSDLPNKREAENGQSIEPTQWYL